MSDVIRKDLGIATAYGYAVSQGYAGTEQQFAALMAAYATVGQQAQAAKDDAVSAKNAAQAAKTAAEAAAESLVIDANPTASSEHAVSSGGVYTALGEKQAEIDTMKGQTDLPAAYKPLAYLESGGTGIFSMGMALNQDSRVVCDFSATEATLAASDTESLFGARKNTTTQGFCVGITASKQVYVGYAGSNNIANLYCKDLNRHTIDVNKNVVSYDGVQVAELDAATFTTPVNGQLLAIRNTSSYYYSHFRIYGCKVYSDGTLARNYIPAMRLSDSAVGFYDTVNSTFTTGSGTVVDGFGADLKQLTDQMIIRQNAEGNLDAELDALTGDVEGLASLIDDNIYTPGAYQRLGMTPIGLKWESGTITASGESADSTRIRQQGYLKLENDVIVECDDGYNVAYRVYKYDGTNYTDVTGSDWVTSLETVRNLIAGNYIRFAAKKAAGGAITPEESKHIHIYGFNDGSNEYFENPNFHNVCHRGFNVVAPENTIPAFALARRVGFRYIETDVQFTSDNVPVILHDRSIARTSDGTGNIDSLTLEQARAYDFGAWKNAIYTGTQIPTFEEMIVWCKKSGVKPYIELKTDITFTQEQVNLLVSIADKYGMLKNCTWISFGIGVLEKLHTAEPNARIGYLVNNKITETDVTNLTALKADNEVFFLPYNSSHSIDTTTFPLAAAAGIPIEACIIDNNTLFAAMDARYSGNITNGYPTNRKLWESAVT